MSIPYGHSSAVYSVIVSLSIVSYVFSSTYNDSSNVSYTSNAIFFSIVLYGKVLFSTNTVYFLGESLCFSFLLCLM